MLYGCGLRVSEATHLTMADVDWEENTLNIRHSKFGRDRRVPMSPSLTAICRAYADVVHPASLSTAFFFCHRDGSSVSEDSVYRRFREVLWLAGIPHRGHGQGPRVHDLRHSFATHTLKAAVDRGVAMQAVLPILSAYLGHASLAATEQYVRLTADAFPELRDQLDQAAGWVIPEVVWE
jgi:integrase